MKKIIYITLLLLLTACSSKYEIKKHYISPIDTEGKLRLKKCVKNKETCQSIYNQEKQECLIKKEEKVRKDFPNVLIKFVSFEKRYKREMKKFKASMKSWTNKYKSLKRKQDGSFCKKSFTNGYTTYTQYPHKYDENDDNDDKCSDATQINRELFLLEERRPWKPIKPIKPSLLRNIKKSQQACSKGNSCTKSYDSCFISSGGKIHHKKIYKN